MAQPNEINEMRDELISHIEEQNEQIRESMAYWVKDRVNHVVVSKDFNYQVTDDGTGTLDVEMLTTMDKALRVSKSTADSIAKSFNAENGYGKIEWVVMSVYEFLCRLLNHNNMVMRYINERAMCMA